MNNQMKHRLVSTLIMPSCLVLLAACGPQEEENSTTELTGSLESAITRQSMATHFDGLGTPAGGCGVPQSMLGTQNFVALNVQNTPNDYSSFPSRPLANKALVGEFNNGLNCGRWVRVTIGDRCQKGANSGAPGSPYCSGGSWVADSYNGSTLDFIVADSCQDGNRWCRDDRYHLDLSTPSLEKFRKNGAVMTGLSQAWNNRRISWDYIPAPGYKGDIKISFRPDAQFYWPAIIITNLPNGIHGVQAQVNGAWQDMKRESDNGQSFVLPSGLSTQRIRVLDANNALLNNGRVYEFSFPSACGAKCTAYTPVKYRTL